jgi:2-furoate---CoA ligase
MFDLGRTLLAVVARSPDALAIVDGERRLSYAAWYREIGRVGGGLAALGLSRRDRLPVILQNRLETATLHWACQSGAARRRDTRSGSSRRPALSYIVVFRLLHPK